MKTWTKTLVALGNHGSRSYSRPGYVDENRQVALPPKNAKKLTWWCRKMGIEAP